MTIYVDDFSERATAARTDRWSHLFAAPGDDLGELHQMAKRLGLLPAWFQGEHRNPHYILTTYRRRQAVAAGAVPVTWQEAGQMLAAAGRRRANRPVLAPIQDDDPARPKAGHACMALCGSAVTRLYAGGWYCPAHTPAARAGQPEPDVARYCAPGRCYCQDPTCPAAGAAGLEMTWPASRTEAA